MSVSERAVQRLRRDFDLSVTLGAQELHSLVGNARADRTLNDTTLLGLSIHQHETRSQPHPLDLTEVFFEITQSGAPVSALETLLRFSHACTDALDRLDAWQRFDSHNAWLSEEADTWRLLHALLTDTPSENPPPAPILTEDDALSPKRLIASYFHESRDIRRMQLVIDWLEACSAYRDMAMPPAARLGGSLHWENTLHHLLNGESLFDSNRTAKLITAMDPDAPRRQKKSLHALDQQDDDNLCRRIFKEIRCGRFEESITLCVDSGQMWRSIILQGHRLLDYPDAPQIDSKYPIIGNQNRDLWKWCCMQYLKSTEENAHFKATLGILSGHLSSVLPLCHDNWEDLLWAHLRIQIENRVDQHLREHLSAAAVSSDDVVQDMLDKLEQPPELSIHQIFGNVKALFKDKSETHYQEIQRHLILEESDSLLHQASLWINDVNHNLIRFLAHLVLILRQIGKDPIRDVSDEILKVYVQKLIENVDGFTVSPELIAHYTVSLPTKLQIQLYSELMWHIEATDDRHRVVEAGTRAGLNVQAAAVETVRHAIKVLKENPSSAPVKDISFNNESSEKIQKLIIRVTSSLEWLSFYDTQICDAVAMNNCIIRILIFKGDVDSATTVLSRLTQFYPTSTIAQHLPSTSNMLREHLCLKAYLEAINGFATWYRQHVGGRPRSPEPLLPECSFTDKVHHEQIKAQIQLQQEQWAATGLHQARHTKQLLYNVLLFPQGWLVDDISDESSLKPDSEEFIDRDKQLLSLRKLCIPEIVLLLLKVLQSGNIEGHVEAIRLSEILSSENRKLYSLFSKHKLREVLHKIGESSLGVLENNRDPWGFMPTIN
ncbi:nuclear pore complex protein Nup107 [Arctopsyche grandis]|uniref:nuclear pore complex protein Nup107 n=1 Tax=Arctopsyche grandis TaxID=121162 RepID=UPI00406D7DDE